MWPTLLAGPAAAGLRFGLALRKLQPGCRVSWLLAAQVQGLMSRKHVGNPCRKCTAVRRMQSTLKTANRLYRPPGRLHGM